MKTPISYYGGKQSMLKYILPLIPEHQPYVEPFFGGGAVFWAKEPAVSEVVNDANGNVVNFYEQLKTNYENLKRLIDATPYSRDIYRKAMVIYDCPFMFAPVERAWAFWVGTIQGFSNQIGTWRSTSIGNNGKESRLLFNKKAAFTKELSERLKHIQIENKDACELIQHNDGENVFFYVDPPYVGSDQGHYGGYLQCHFDTLLETLAKIKGMFLLSSYPNERLLEFTSQFGWWSKPIDMSLSASNTKGKRKVEMLTGNYVV